MGESISEVLPFAIGVAVSPIPLVAVILMLFTPRAGANGTAFLVGWVAGLGALAAVVYLVVDAANAATSSTASDSTSAVRIVLGAVLIALAVRKWRRRAAPGAEPEMPKWMSRVDHFTPVQAAELGVVLGAVNPKNLVLTIGAASGLAQMGESTVDAVVGLLAFVVIASSTTAGCVAYRTLGGDRSRANLEDARTWLTTHHDAVMIVLFLVFGVVLLAQGVGRLSA